MPCNYGEHPSDNAFCTRTGADRKVLEFTCRKSKCPNYVEENILDEKDVTEYVEQAKSITSTPKREIKRKDLFFKLFPDAQVEVTDMPIGKVPRIRPCELDVNYSTTKKISCYDISCDICRGTFWNEDVE